jgi:hypothetical protein
MIRNGILSVLLVAAGIGCALASPPQQEKKQKVLTGSWGGPHASLEVTGETARIEYDCAQGTIDGPIVLDREGRFEASGTHAPERGGPVREGQEDSSQPARYRGHVAGKTLTLTLILMGPDNGSGKEVGTFTLTQGAAGRLFKCL